MRRQFIYSLREGLQASGVLSSVVPSSVINLSPASLEPAEITEINLSRRHMQTDTDTLNFSSINMFFSYLAEGEPELERLG